MKKITATLCVLAALVGGVGGAGRCSAADATTVTPFLLNFTSAAVSVYTIGGATTTAASMAVYPSSMSLTTVGGLCPGTTYLVFADTNKDTLVELRGYLTAMSTMTAGAEGGVVMTMVNGCLDKNLSTELQAGTFADVYKSTGARTVYIDRVLGMSYTLPAAGAGIGGSYHVTGLSAFAVWGVTTATTTLKAYDGTAATDTQILQYKMQTTTVDTPVLWIPMTGEFTSSASNKAMRFDIESSTWVTAGYINGTAFRR